MKTNLIKMLFATAIAVLMSACSSGNNDPEDPDGGGGQSGPQFGLIAETSEGTFVQTSKQGQSWSGGWKVVGDKLRISTTVSEQGVYFKHSSKRFETYNTLSATTSQGDAGLFEGYKIGFTKDKSKVILIDKEGKWYSCILNHEGKSEDKNASEEVDMISIENFVDLISGIEPKYEIDRCSKLFITPTIDGYDGAEFKWVVSSNNLGINDRELSQAENLVFVMLDEGEYKVEFKVSTPEGKETNVTTVVNVKRESKAYSPYISELYDYMPAAGQFVNVIPKWEEGDTHQDIVRKAGETIIGEKTSMIHLGGFGGYVEFGFDHTIVNVPGERDFRVLGNASWSTVNPNPGDGRGGNCEPGVIQVAYDKNGNGKPDADEWYEIWGSEHFNEGAFREGTVFGYEITYHKPKVEKPEVLDEYIYWEDNLGNSGYKEKNATHLQSYFPNWISSNTITFKGTLLPNNAVDESGAGKNWVLYSFKYGYADNAPNTDDESAIDIDWAYDKSGNKVYLPGIDFVRIYTGLNQDAGWIGDTSTEVSGAYDLHLKGEKIATR